MPKHMPPTRETNPIRPGRSARIGRPHLAYDASRHESSSFSPESRRFLPLRVLRRCRRFLGLPRRRPLLPFVLRYPALFRLFQAPVARPLSPSLSTLTVALTPAADLAGLRVGRRFADKVHRLLLVTPGRSLPVSKLAHIVPGARWRRAGEVGRAGELLRARAHGLGGKAWEEASVFSGELEDSIFSGEGGGATKCPGSLALGGGSGGGAEGETVAFLPCGLSVGSAVTVVGTAQAARAEYVEALERSRAGNGTVMVAQFAVELRGLRAADGEEPPRILHLNPRLRGDWSRRPVLEMNTCFRMQWGKAQRCDGTPSKDDDHVDGFPKCEKWEWRGTVDSKETKTSSWLNRFIGRAKKPEMSWPYPFSEEKMFVLTIQAGVEGYHINVGGRHVASFPHRMGFTLEDATGLAVTGGIDVHSVYATSLPKAHPSFSLQQVLEMSDKWKARPVPEEPIQLFIGILSATNHFAERMAIRKTWMQFPAIQLGNVVARFFVALSQRNEINAALKKEAEYFGDVVILPFIDRYELVVLKTVAICEYGVQNVSAEYIMKCDDDTFLRVDIVLQQLSAFNKTLPLYLGNLNLLHRPLRSGKWAVTYEEWPEAVYPPYANGPGYVISVDIARDIVSRHANQSLRLFKMEDVSMGMWVEDYNVTANPVQYIHSWRFCQYGCVDNYFTAHYQSPRQMLCLWDKLSIGRARCCNYR